MGAAGHDLERVLLDYAKQHGINVVGPNSTGLVNVRTGLAMSMTSVLTEGVPITAGGIAVIAQSGAIGSTVVERARDAGVGISHIVSTGNQRDMDIPDFISYFAGLPEVHTVALYMESIRDGRRFAAAVEQLHDAGKRLITYLGGRTAAGEQAAASHTGKIIGRGALELALLRALDVTVVDDPDDLWVLGTATAPSQQQFPRRWGMVAYSGGMAVLATEQLASAGVVFPPLGTSTTQRLKALLPSFAAIPNPLDVGPGSMPRHFGGYLAAVAADPGRGGGVRAAADGRPWVERPKRCRHPGGAPHAPVNPASSYGTGAARSTPTSKSCARLGCWWPRAHQTWAGWYERCSVRNGCWTRPPPSPASPPRVRRRSAAPRHCSCWPTMAWTSL